MLEDQYWGAVRNREGKLMLTVMPMFETIGAVFDLMRRVDVEHYDRMCAALEVEPLGPGPASKTELAAVEAGAA